MSIDLSWFHRRRRRRQISAFADGELTGEQSDRVAEDLVFDDDARQQLRELRQVDAIIAEALATTPATCPDPQAVAEAVVRAKPMRPPSAVSSRNWTPTVVASVGLLVTAGVAFAGYRRRSSS